MRTRLLVVALFGAVAVAAARGPLPDAALKSATEADIAYLTKSLETEPKKNAVNSIKATAMLVALEAQKAGNGGLQEQALAVAAAVGKKDFGGAKAAAGKLAGATGGTPKAGNLAEQGKLSLGELMSVYRKGTVGGLNLEADIKTLGKKLTDPKLAQLVGARNALIAEYTAVLPEGADTPEKQKQWAGWCKDQAELGTAIAEEAAKGAKADAKLVEKKMKALEQTCSACHTAFRDK